MENKQQDKKDNNRFERKYILDKNCSWIFKDFLIRKNFFNQFEKRNISLNSDRHPSPNMGSNVNLSNSFMPF